MALIADSTTQGAEFVPAAGEFSLTVEGTVQLQASPAAGWPFENVLNGYLENTFVLVRNSVPGTRYRWEERRPGSSARADQ